MPPLYDPEMVKPMEQELTNVGVSALKSAEDVNKAILSTPGTALLVINSVCGCAAGNCRPGVTLALQNDKIPDNLYTVFAGVDMEAVQRARDLMTGVQPSSPNVALFQDGKLLGILERRHIERMSAVDIANALTKVFNEYCNRKGPSVPREVFEQNGHVDVCGSTIPLYKGN
jgi:putative YphP/YqiW family bacilliredoxin